MVRDSGPAPAAPRARLLLALLVLWHLANGALAISRDNYIMLPDATDLYALSVRAAAELRAGQPGEALRILWGDPQRGPLGFLPAVALQALGGGASPRLARASGLLWLALLLLATYLVGCRLHSPEAGLLSAALLAAMPLVMGFSRLFWLDLPLVAMTALSVWALLRTEGFARPRAALLLGLVAGLGLLVKHGLPLFLGPVALVYLALSLRRAEPGRRWRRLALAALAGLVALAVFATWAAFHAEYVVRALRMAIPGVLAREAPGIASAGADPARFTHYLIAIPTRSAGPLLSALYVVAFAALVRRDRRRILGLTGAWLWGSVALLSLVFVPWDRYALPALAAMALATGAGLLQLPALRRHRTRAVPALCALLALLALQQSWFGPRQDTWFVRHPWPASERPFKSGMVRPHAPAPRRPDLRGIAPWPSLSFAVVPTRLWPAGRPPPFDRLMESVWQWLITDTERLVNCDELAPDAPLTPARLARNHLLFVARPDDPRAVPPDQRRLYRRVRRLVRQDPRRWRPVLEQPYPHQARLRVFRNLRPVPAGGGEAFQW
jgi:hypothetical protein